VRNGADSSAALEDAGLGVRGEHHHHFGVHRLLLERLGQFEAPARLRIHERQLERILAFSSGLQEGRGFLARVGQFRAQSAGEQVLAKHFTTGAVFFYYQHSGVG
jgi:hypothetical protein